MSAVVTVTSDLGDLAPTLARDGVVVLRGALPAALLEDLSRDVETFLAQAAWPGCYCIEHGGRAHLNRANAWLARAPLSTAALLTHASLRELAARVVGEPYVSVLESLIVKHAHVPYAVPPHRDMVHAGRATLVTVGVHLDDVVDGGHLAFVVGSHDDERRAPAALAPVHTRRGDLVVHDVRTLHATTQNRGPDAIRTLYFELRPQRYFDTEGTWSPEMLARRAEMMELVARIAAHAPGTERDRDVAALAAIQAEPFPLEPAQYLAHPVAVR